MAASTPEQQRIHKTNLLRIVAKALEHAANQFLTDSDPVKKITRDRIDQVLNGTFDANQVKKERKQRHQEGSSLWTTSNCLLRASEEFVLLADYGGHLSGSKLQKVFVPCWDAALDDVDRAHTESNWQHQNIHPLVEQAFENYGVPITLE
jgi:hypothetical protein